MMKGYFVILHDIKGADICFIEYSKESDQLFKDFRLNKYDDDRINELWNDYEDLNGISTECYDGDTWKFNGYDIIDVFTVFQY